MITEKQDSAVRSKPEADQAKKPPKRRRASRKVRMLEEALEAEQGKSKEYLSRLKYLQADFDNYRKRMVREFQEVTQRSNERLIASVLNVVDDLERAIETGRKTENTDALLEGVEMVYKNLYGLLEREGLTRIKAIGKPFDPNMHEILAKVPTDDHDDGIVIEEARKGFIFKGKVMRPSVVMISSKKEGSEEK
ncbi:MAG: nucleotide exchange factor GrpE [Candidatus Bathyarchaeota archaeon]|nr:nucleotide exchange factor GrpE [Candidatus Bathyarchaeota archaeon]MDH5686780.1 nucleotide exchange factor GrpE [Candidatus Bathyarchaeota archaeon]